MKRKPIMKLLAASVALAASGAACAGSLTLDQNGSVTDQGWTFSGLTGSGTLKFSQTLRDALTLANTKITVIDPAILVVESSPQDGFTRVEAMAPVVSTRGVFDGTTLNLQSVQTTGGANLRLPGEFDDDASGASTGGSIAISNLRVDLTNKDIYATLSGGNGVGTVDNLKLWKINQFEGPTSFAAKEGETVFQNTLGALTIYEEAFNLFVKAGGLTDLGVGALAGVNDLAANPEGYGTVTSTIKFSATAAVPEPSTYALMGVGLVGLGSLVRRRQGA